MSQRHICFRVVCIGHGRDNTMMQFGGAYSFLSTVGRGSRPASEKSHSSQVCPESCLFSLPFQHSFPRMPFLAAHLPCPSSSQLLYQPVVKPPFQLAVPAFQGWTTQPVLHLWLISRSCVTVINPHAVPVQNEFIGQCSI